MPEQLYDENGLALHMDDFGYPQSREEYEAHIRELALREMVTQAEQRLVSA